MTRAEWFAVLAKHAERLPFILLACEGTLAFHKNQSDPWLYVKLQSADSDVCACALILWLLDFLESQTDKGGKLNPMLFRRPDGKYECAFPNILGRFVEDARLDAAGNAVAAWLEAQNG